METYTLLLQLKLEHDYYPDKRCRAIVLQPTAQCRRWLNNRQLVWHGQEAEWNLIGKKEVCFDREESLEIELIAGHEHFFYFTQWSDECTGKQFRLQIEDKQTEWPLPSSATTFHPSGQPKKLGVVTVPLSLLPPPAKERKPQLFTFTFKAPELYWEYLFIPRNGETRRQVELIDDAGLITFTALQPDVAHGKEGWRCSSEQAIAVRESYPFRLRLIEKTPFGNKTLMRNVASPRVGQFVWKKGAIHQICYF